MAHPAASAPPSNASLPVRAGVDPAILERFRPFESAPTGMLLVDRHGVILASNACLDRIFEYDPGELRGMLLEVLTPSAVRERHKDLRDAFFEYPVPRQMGAARELYGVSKSGRPVPVEIGLTTLQIEGDQFVLAFVLNLTEHKKQEEKFRLVVEAAPNGIIMVGPQGRIKLANHEACAMFGFGQEELIGEPVEMLLPERFRHKHQVYRGSFTQAPENRAMGAGRELFGRRKDGSEFPIEIGLTPIDSPDGRFIISTLIDITGRKKAEEEIRAKNQQLSRLNEELTHFTYSVSHDLKAPLTAIQGLARIAVEDLEANEIAEVHANLDRISAQAQHLTQLVQDVLALAKLDAEPQSWAPVDISRIVREAAEALRQPAECARVEFRTTLQPDLVGRWPPIWLRQIAENLISNAIKYSDPQKPSSSIEIAAAAREGGVELTVRDNGVGIPEAFHPQVFGMFKRFHPDRAGGSGLGLALVKKYVERLRGSIAFESSPAGTTFRVTLPLDPKC